MRFVRRFDARLVLGSALFLLLALLGVTGMVVNRYQDALLLRNEEQTLRDFTYAEDQIVRLTQEARRSAIILLGREEVSACLNGNFDRDVDRVRALVAALDKMDETLAYEDSLSGVWFFREDGTMIGATPAWHFAYEQSPHPFFESAGLKELPPSGAVTWLGGMRLGELTEYPPRGAAASAGDGMVLGGLRTDYRVREGDGTRSVFTVFAVGQAALRRCFETLGSEGEEVYLLDQDGRQLVGVRDEAMGEIPWFAGEGGAPANGTFFRGEDRYEVMCHPLPRLGWTLCKAIPYGLYNGQVRQLRRAAWGIGALVLLVALVTYAAWAVRMLRPMREISAALDRVRAGDLNVTLPRAYGVEEFEVMRVSFNEMLAAIREMLRRTREMEHERIELELRNLQTQLNPHMVFNSITSIRFMAMMSGADKVSDMLVCLADLIRPVFSEWRLLWPLQDELNYAKNYVKLLTLRFGGLIAVDMRADSQVMDARLPCFTLQPLLENCVQHGMIAGKPLRVRVEAALDQEGYLCLTVTDDGRGIPPDRLAALRQRMEAPPDAAENDGEIGHTGIGVINICRRARLFTADGRTGDMQIDSAPDAGTRIALRLPYTTLDPDGTEKR